MVERQVHKPAASRVSKQAQPNPQGKAALPQLAELQQWRTAATPAADVETLLAHYLCGLLVLSADFRFKPRPGPTYHLYYRDQRWQLSLVAPAEWRPQRWSDYAASCMLRVDATWQINPAPDLVERPAVLDALLAFEQAFRDRLRSAATLSSDLPHYERSLPYYQRVLASGLASSLEHAARGLQLEHHSGVRLLQLSANKDGSLSLAEPDNGQATPALEQQ